MYLCCNEKKLFFITFCHNYILYTNKDDDLSIVTLIIYKKKNTIWIDNRRSSARCVPSCKYGNRNGRRLPSCAL